LESQVGFTPGMSAKRIVLGLPTGLALKPASTLQCSELIWRPIGGERTEDGS